MFGAVRRVWGWTLACVAWLHALVVAPLGLFLDRWVVGSWEEVVRAVVRHSFLEVARFLSGLGSLVMSFLAQQPQFRQQLRRSWQNNPWLHHSRARPSSLNAILEALRVPSRACRVNCHAASRACSGA